MGILKKILKFLLKFVLWFILFLLTAVISIWVFSYHYYNIGYNSILPNEKERVFSGMLASDIILTDSGTSRRTVNTFLSIPEWYIVSISDDYTTWLEQGKNPSDFPYWQYLKDYWMMYGKLTANMDGTLPRDYEYHTMVKVIGGSTVLEFGLKAIYEASIGRLTSFFSYNSDIDTYYTHVSRQYVDFILLRPWYEFDYSEAIRGMHFNINSGLLRSTERFILYYSEFFIKSFYAKAMGYASHTSFGIADIWTGVQGEFPANVLTFDPKNIITATGGIYISRYHPFTEIYPKILEHFPDSVISSIAGNKKIIIEIQSQAPFENSILDFPVPIDPIRRRLFLYIQVTDLPKILNNPQYQLMHIYDF